MPTSGDIIAVQETDGFVHRGRIVYALEYWLETPPPQSRSLIVWLTPAGDASAPWIRHGEAGRRIVTTNPGETILFKDERLVVKEVKVFRESPLPAR